MMATRFIENFLSLWNFQYASMEPLHKARYLFAFEVFFSDIAKLKDMIYDPLAPSALCPIMCDEFTDRVSECFEKIRECEYYQTVNFQSYAFLNKTSVDRFHEHCNKFIACLNASLAAVKRFNNNMNAPRRYPKHKPFVVKQEDLNKVRKRLGFEDDEMDRTDLK